MARELAVTPELAGATRTSARNRFVGLVTKVVMDTVMAQVEMQCGPFRVVSLMSSEAVRELGLEPGSIASAVIKATHVVIEAETPRSRPQSQPTVRLRFRLQIVGRPRSGRKPVSAVRRSRAAVACLAATAALALTLGAAGCSTVGGGPDAAEGDAGPTTLTVYAAASLQEPFEDLGEQFEADHEGVDVEFSFAGSSTLVGQIQQGAPADVFASANTSNMDKLVDADLQAADPVEFTTNTLMIAVPAGNPVARHRPRLAHAGARSIWSSAHPTVPCGAADRTAVERSRRGGLLPRQRGAVRRPMC